MVKISRTDVIAGNSVIVELTDGRSFEITLEQIFTLDLPDISPNDTSEEGTDKDEHDQL